MKKLVLLCFLAAGFSSSAQIKEGKIVFERVQQMPTRMFSADPALAAQIPKSRTDQFELLFTQAHSLWQYLPNANNEGDGNTFASGGMVVRFQMGANDISYFNFEQGTRVDQREIADRSYVVTDSIRKLNWKMSDETKVVLGFTTHKATTTRISMRSQMSMENGEMKRTQVPDTATIVAWFTTDIPVPAGPDFQGQLPGMIMELDVAKGQTVYKAIELSPKVNTSKIKEPKEGKKLTAAEFSKEREKIMEEMRQRKPSGNNIRVMN